MVQKFEAKGQANPAFPHWDDELVEVRRPPTLLPKKGLFDTVNPPAVPSVNKTDWS